MRKFILCSIALTVAIVALVVAVNNGGEEKQQQNPVVQTLPPPPKALGEASKTVDRAGTPVYKVHVKGPDLLTHGPDPVTRDAKSPLKDDLKPNVRGEPVAEGSPICRKRGYAQRVLYAYQSTNHLTQYKDDFRRYIRYMDDALNQASLESGGRTAHYEVACDPDGQISVRAFRVPGAEFSDVVNAAIKAGYHSRFRDYTIFLEADNSQWCGVGSFESDDRLIRDNLSNTGNGYAITYQPCWTGHTPMHENGHNQGAVQDTAPDSSGAGHCNDGDDVMCYNDGGPNATQRNVCTDREHFDCGHDDYFDSRPEAGSYLYTHWNIGSIFNRFIVLGR